MKDFTFNVPTDIRFGRNALDSLAAGIKKYGTKVLLVYGGGSVKKTGLYDNVTDILKEAQIPYAEVSGVEPNPKLGNLVEGLRIAREAQIDVVLAVGGGSVIDCGKAIAACFDYEGDPWDIVTKKAALGRVLPILTIQTMPGTGSEMSTSSVISRMDINKKVGFSDASMRPKMSFMNPEYTFTVPKESMAAGIADAFSHVVESYFSNVREAYLQARIGESICNTLVTYGAKSVREPDDYEARANILWACSWAINGILTKGNPVTWSMHSMENELSGYFDIAHGVGLAILVPAWLKWMLREENAYRYVEFGKGVFGILADGRNEMETAREVIEKTEEFFASMGLAAKLGEVGITKEKLPVMASNIGDTKLAKAFVSLDAKGILEILELAY